MSCTPNGVPGPIAARGIVGPMKPVKLYAKSTCIWCWKAKLLLRRNGVPYEVVDASSDAVRAWLIERTGKKTVPQVFFGDDAVGGFDDLSALEASGSLMARLEGAR